MNEANQSWAPDLCRIELAMDVGNMAWWELDCLTGAIRFHRKKADRLGYDPERFKHYEDFKALLHPEDRRPSEQALNDCLTGHTSQYRIEYRLRSSCGGYLWFLDAARVTRKNDSGEPQALTGITLDISDRKLEEKNLRDSEERLREVLEHSLDASYHRSLTTNSYIYLSPTFSKLSGFTLHELKSMSVAEILAHIHPDDRSHVLSSIDDALLGTPEFACHLEYRFRHKKGCYLWIHDQFIVLRDSDGRPIALIGSVRDITDHKQAQEEVKANEAHFRKLFHGHSAVKLVIDPSDGAIIDANAAAANYYGWSIDELKRMTIHQINALPPDKVTKAISLVNSTENSHFEFQHRRADKSIRDVEVFCNRIELAQRTYIYSIIHDISERKRIEEALKQSENRYRLLAENATDVIWVLDPYNHRFRHISPSVHQLLGYDLEELLTKSFDDLLHPSDRALFLERTAERLTQFLDAPTTPHRFRDEAAHVHKNGSTVWTEVISRFYVNALTGQVEIQGASRDITEQRRAEDALRENERRLVRAEEFARFGHWQLSLSNRILCASAGAMQIFGFTTNIIPLAAARDCTTAEYRPLFDEALEKLVEHGTPYDIEFKFCRPSDGNIVTIHARAEHDPRQQLVFGVIQDVTARKRTEAERELLIIQLQTALEQIKALKGIVPICACCKKIRDDKGFWEQVEGYLSRHTGAQFSHGMCPECMRRFYPGL